MIDPMNSAEVEHWARDMQVQSGDVRAAIRLVGRRLSDLRRYFGKSAHVIVLEDKRKPAAVSPYGLPA
jgi:hypothetical protein